MAYRLLVFDFDGTLVDTVDDIAFYANETLRAHGFPEKNTGQVRKAIGLGVHELLKALAPGFEGKPDELEAAVERFKESYRMRPVRRTDAFHGVRDTLEGVLHQVPKGIVTNKPQDITLSILKELDLAKHFQIVIGMHAGFPPKPDPSGLWHVSETLKFTRRETVYIGDSRVDAKTCVAAGVDFAFMDYGYDTLGDEKAVYRFSSAAQWSGLLA